MKWKLALIASQLPGAAFAHAGHLGALAGHDHVIAGVAVGAAVGIAVWGWLKGKTESEGSDDTEPSGEEADA